MRSSVTKALLAASVTIGASSIVSGAIAARFAHELLTPSTDKPDDVHVLASTETQVTFARNAVTEAPGRYGMYWDDERGHAQIGEIVHQDDAQVTRRLLRVTRGELLPGPARMSSYFYALNPGEEFAVPCENLMLPTPLGPAPCWVVPSGDGTRWAVLIHGRGARRFEVMRAVPTLVDLGISCVIPSYRNDQEAPASEDSRYGLGLREWRDVESALDLARQRGAKSIDLLGWSMGGAIALQLARHSRHRDAISRIFLDGPVLDWRDVMRFHASEHRIPRHIDQMAAWMMGNRYLCRLVGLRTLVDVRASVAADDDIRVPTLIIHSVDDDFVPVAPSRRLAESKPELVRWVGWEKAGHVREWNTDPDRWERELRQFFAD